MSHVFCVYVHIITVFHTYAGGVVRPVQEIMIGAILTYASEITL